MATVTAVCVKNIFDPLPSRVVKTFDHGQTAQWYARQFFPVDPVGLELMIAVDGHLIEHPETRVVAAGESLSFCAVPHGGGGDGSKNILRVVAMIALVVVAAYTGGAAFGAAGSFGTTGGAAGAFGASAVGYAVVSGAVMMVGGLLINSIFPAQMPSFDMAGMSSFEDSRTYGWNQSPQVEEPGTPLPVLYGTRRVSPPLINSYIETRGDKQYLNALFAVAGHKVDSISGVRINDQPIANFNDVVVETRLGTNDQTTIPFFNDTRTDVGIGVKFSTDWITRQTTGLVDSLGIALQAPQGLWFARDNGGLGSVTLNIQIQYKKVGTATWYTFMQQWSPGSGFRSRLSNTAFSTTTLRQANLRRNIRVGDRITATVSGALAGEFTVSSISQVRSPIVYESYTDYDGNTQTWTTGGELLYYQINITGTLPAGMNGFLVDATGILSGAQNSPKRWFFEQENPVSGLAQYEYRFRFSTAPPTGSRYGSDLFVEYHQQVLKDSFSYPNTALLAIRALATDQLSGGRPRVTTLTSRNTVPVWTGAAYEDRPAVNPAWINYHQLHSVQNGGGVAANRIIYDDFAEFAAECAVNNRECHIYIDTEMSLKTAMDSVSMIGRGQVVQVGSKFTVHFDSPTVPAQRFLFTMGNIGFDSFTEEWLSMEDRADVIEITYWDATNDYSREVITVYQDGFNEKTGSIHKQAITLPGCVNKTLAAKYGKLLLNKNRYLTLTASWGADIDAIGCFPNEVIDVAHDVPQWGYSGRVIEGTETIAKLDREVTLDPGKTYALEIKFSDDTREFKTITVSTSTTTDELITSAWSQIPQQYDIYTFGELARQYKQFRVLQISCDSELRRTLSCLEHVPEVYADSVAIPDPPVSELGQINGFNGREVWVAGSDGAGRSVVDLTWRIAAEVPVNVYWRQPGDEWSLLAQTEETFYRVTEPLTLGATYEFAVSRSEPGAGQTLSVMIGGKLAPPSDVTGFQAWQKDGRVYFRWEHIPDIDLWGYEIREGLSWEKGQFVLDGEQKNSGGYPLSRLGTHVYWIKAIDNSDIYSVNATSASLNVTEAVDLNVVLNVQEIPTQVEHAALFNFGLGVDDKVYWLPGATDEDFPTDTDTDLSTYEGDTEPGIYTTQEYDIGAVVAFGHRVDVDFEAIARAVTDLTYPDRTDRSYPLDTDVVITSLSTFKAEFRVSDDNVTWSDWQQYSGPIDLSGRYIQDRVTTVLDSDNVYFWLNQITTTDDVPDKIATLFNRPIDNTGTTFDLLNDFGLIILQQYTVETTVLGAIAKYPTADKSAGSFVQWLFDSAGNAVSGNVDITVRGF